MGDFYKSGLCLLVAVKESASLLMLLGAVPLLRAETVPGQAGLACLGKELERFS